MILTIVLTASLMQLLVAVFVLSKKIKDISNILFACVSFSLIAWALANYLSTVLDGNELLYAMRAVMFLVVLQNTFLAFFCYSFPAKRLKKFSWRLWAYIALSVLAGVFTLTPLVFVDTSLVNGTPYPEAAPGMVVFLLHAAASVVLGIQQLIKKRRQAVGVLKGQMTFMILGAALLWAIVPFTNLVVTLLLQTTIFIRLSAVYVLIFSSIIAYAIVRHRLFDIRLVVARSVAYSSVIVTMGLTYGFIVFGLADRFFPNSSTTTLQQAFYTLSAVFLAFTFQPIKRFFDRLTDRVFYRDRYDTEDVLNRMGKIFVAKSNSFELLDESLKIITSTLKVDFGHLIVLDKGKPYKVAHIGANSDLNANVNELNRFKRPINILDELENNAVLQNTLKSINAYAMVKLETQDSLIGYLALGVKRSGTIFTQQDVNLLEILSQELAVAIQNAKSYEEIQAFSETLEKEVEEATAKLRETNKRLVKLDEAKDEFISMASHQLRTPLTTIKGYLSMLLEGDAGKLPKKPKGFIDLAFVSSERMAHLISDMLNVSRISTGRLTIDVNDVDLVKVVESELEQLHSQAEARNIKLKLHQPKKKLPKIKIDENKIRQVIMNFTDNAIYYTPDGNVDVYVEEKGDSVEFRVEDNGIGVSKEAQKQLFSKFFRAENAQKVRPDGTGLGLYMAKQVIEAQDGEIIFSSKENQGSTFGFRFNLKDKQAE